MRAIIKRFDKRGQESIGMSFNMIFSIFIIAVIIAIAVYVIVKFVDTSKCANTGLFYSDLQDEINKKRAGDDYSDIYEGEIKSSGALRSGLSQVCFGNLSSIVARGSSDEKIFNNLTRISRYKENNVFMYPPDKACNGLESKKLDYVKIDNFFCINVKDNNGNIFIRLKGENGSPVNITEV